jgi:hypothetical protein
VNLNGLLKAKPPVYDLSNYQRYFRMYDADQSPKLGPEPTKQELLDAAAVLKAEGRAYWQALEEAAGTVTS